MGSEMCIRDSLYTQQHGVEENLFLAPGEGDSAEINGDGSAAVARSSDLKANALGVLKGEVR